LFKIITDEFTTIEQAWENRALLQEETTTKAIREVIELLAGKLRVAEPKGRMASKRMG
jgi:2,3,4,5-tetrahydropyridine-2-carboxylate N-succinyltransferase